MAPVEGQGAAYRMAYRDESEFMLSGPAEAAHAVCSELECLRGRLNEVTLAAAASRSAAIGTGADQVLIAGGHIDESAYIDALSAWSGIAREPLDGLSRIACPLTEAQLLRAVHARLLPLRIGPDLVWLFAPLRTDARHIAKLATARPDLTHRMRLASHGDLQRFAVRHAATTFAEQAANGLRRRWPRLCAARFPSPNRMSWAGLFALLCAALWYAPSAALMTVDIALSLGFVVWMGLRLWCAGVHPPPRASRPASATGLPTYTVIAAVYREASSVKDLARALQRLNYPGELLDVKLVLEADDLATRRAVAALDLPPWFETVLSPALGPRTKPKALNAALALARGDFTVIYDAEDRPHPNQLHDALNAFRKSGRRIACVQAALTIDNMADSWLARMFTAEYAGHFDIFLPGLAALGQPLPLGGTSNHFRTRILRDIGGWDPYNVTEDADLGIRLARFGYRCAVIGSTTYEEAPARLPAWIRQRTRWFKGWMQTWLVHMRHPVALWRELGAAGFATLQLTVLGNTLSALLHPVFLATLVYAGFKGGTVLVGEGPVGMAVMGLHTLSVVGTYVVSAVVSIQGLGRRGLGRNAWILFLMPVHCLLLSVAAWRAVYMLAKRPHAWEKTEHGLARTSRLREAAGGARIRAEAFDPYPKLPGGRTLLTPRRLTWGTAPHPTNRRREQWPIRSGAISSSSM